MDSEPGSRDIGLFVLGPLRLEADGSRVEVPGVKRQAVLALLAMASPHAVSPDRLIDALWPEDPPPSGAAALQSHISRIRRHLGSHRDRLEHSGAGYRLDLLSGELDAAVWEQRCQRARELARTDRAAAREVLVEARSLWQGSPLSGLGHVDDLGAWARRLTEQWFDASQLLVECALEEANVAVATAVATEIAAADPLRETATAALVRALAEQGRSAEALRVAHEFRRNLAEETGLEPTPALAELEQNISEGSVGPRAVSATLHLPRDVETVPAPAVPLLGRDAELAGVERLLARERLVTIIGPGGVGKTHFALEVCRRAAPDRTPVVVRLESITDGAAIGNLLARSLGLQADAGDLLGRCAARLGSEPHLVVLDNCEHVLPETRGVVVALLEACPSLTVLATSRERLAVAPEQTCWLAPLPMPDPEHPEKAPDVASVALFMDRARRAAPDIEVGTDDLAAVVNIVRAVDGLPLAIELAAGRLGAMSVSDIEARLDRALDVLGRGAASDRGFGERQGTLRAAIDWSYDLLPDKERRVFRHLAVFSDGVDLAVAEGVADELGGHADAATSLAHLVDASMLVLDRDGPSRYRMLDVLRRFGLDRLRATGELDEATTRLRRWALDFVRWFEVVAETDDEVEAAAQMECEFGNLRAAWNDARADGDFDAAAEIALRLYWAAGWRNLTEVWHWGLELIEDESLAGHRWEAAMLGLAADAAWYSRGDLDRAYELARHACEHAHPGDTIGFAVSRSALANVTFFRGDYTESGRLMVASRQGTLREAEGRALAALAAGYEGHLDAADELLSTARRNANFPSVRAWIRYVDGELDGLRGDLAGAETAYREAIAASSTTGASFITGVASLGLVTTLAARGAIGEALAGYAELIDYWERTGGWTQQWTTIRNLAELLDQIGDADTAISLRAAAETAPESASVGSDEPERDVAVSRPTPPDRGEVIVLARAAIRRHGAEWRRRRDRRR